MPLSSSTTIYSARFFTTPSTTQIFTLSLHDALPICGPSATGPRGRRPRTRRTPTARAAPIPSPSPSRSEEHTSELQSRVDLVCRLLLEKKNQSVNDNSQAVQIRPYNCPGHHCPFAFV